MKVKKVIKAIAIYKELWDKALAKAKADKVSLSSLISDFLTKYVG